MLAREFGSSPAHDAPTRPGRGRADSFETLQDLVFAAATITAIGGWHIGGSRVPFFAIFGLTAIGLNLKSFDRRSASLMLVPPLILFLAYHIAWSYRMGFRSGIFYTLQVPLLFSYAWVFVARYARVPMGRYLFFTGISV